MSINVKKTSMNKIDMCEGPLLAKFIRFAIPIMLSNVFQQFFNAADMMVVGIFCGDISLAAITSTSSICALLTGLLLGISIGANVLAARHFGAKNDEQLSKTVHTSLVFSFIAGIIITTFGLIFSPMLLSYTKVPENVVPLSKLYLFIYFIGIIPTVIFTYAAAVLRAVGDTKRPLYYLTFAGALNVVLNVIFVSVFHLDVAGVAIATVISQTAALVLIIRCLIKETGAIHLDFKKLALDKTIAIKILKVGFPAGLQTALFSISNIAIQASINRFGDSVISGNGAAQTLESFAYMAMSAWTVVVVSSTSQNFGKRNYKRIIKSQIVGHACVIVTEILIALIIALFGEALLSIYVDSETAMQTGLLRFNYVLNLYFIYGIIDILTAGMRGLDCSFIPMIITFFGSVVLRVVWVNTICTIPEYNTLNMVFAAYPASWIVTAVALLVVFIAVFRRTVKRYPSDI